MSGRRCKAGQNSYWQFLMSERKAKPNMSQVKIALEFGQQQIEVCNSITQEDLQIHVAKMWRRGGFDSYGRHV